MAPVLSPTGESVLTVEPRKAWLSVFHPGCYGVVELTNAGDPRAGCAEIGWLQEVGGSGREAATAWLMWEQREQPASEGRREGERQIITWSGERGRCSWTFHWSQEDGLSFQCLFNWLSWVLAVASSSLLFFSRSAVSDSLWPHGLQHMRLPCPSLSLRACWNSCCLGQWCHPTVSSSVTPFSSCPPSFPASGTFPIS